MQMALFSLLQLQFHQMELFFFPVERTEGQKPPMRRELRDGNNFESVAGGVTVVQLTDRCEQGSEPVKTRNF